MILDCHAHVASPSHLPDAFFHGWAENVCAGAPGPPDEARMREIEGLLRRVNGDPRCERLLAEMDEAGIDRAVLLVIDFGFAFPEPMDRMEANHREVRELMDTGRFIGFAGVDPRRGAAGQAMLENALGEQGFSGMKLYPPCGYSPSDPALFPFYEVCAAHGAPVLVHTGPTSPRLSFRHARPFEVEEAAFRFPTVNFILAHAGVVWHEDAALLAEFRPNVYLDLSGFQTEVRRGGFAEILHRHLRRGLSRKLLFGTDWPIYRLFGSQKDWVDAVRSTVAGLGYPSATADDVLGDNMARVLSRGAEAK